MIRIKTADDVQRTLRDRRSIDRGFFSNRTLLGLTAAAVVIAPISPVASTLPILALALDFGRFVSRRRAILRRYMKGAPRLVTPDDFEMVNRAWEESGRPEPTMSDFEGAAGLTSRPWANDLRYVFLLNQYRGGTVADIGCGDGRLCWRYEICPPEQYIGVDPGRDLIRVLHNKTEGRGRGIVGVAEATTLPDDSVDLVVCSECFEHLPDPGSALREFARIARPGGMIVIQTPSAYRVRNLNPFHVLATMLGRLLPSILLRTVVHENTFVEAYTYHWDFTRHDFARYIRGLPLTLTSMTTATYRFDPNRSHRHRFAYHIARQPIFDWIWWDMTVVLKKLGSAPESVTVAGGPQPW